MKTILVTGGAGFIGSNLCDSLLKLGFYVVNIDNFNNYYDPSIKESNICEALKNQNYKLYRGDILDKKLINKIFNENKVDAVIHLAAMAGVRNSLSDPLEYVDVDIKGTVNLLQICVENGVKKVIAASSSSVYGVNSKVPFSEDDNVELQISPYATAKRAMELYCSTYTRLYDISVACLRFFTVYGPRQRPEMAIHMFTKNIAEGNPINMFGDGNSERDYTYVDDIVDGIILLINKEFKSEIFNFGNNDIIKLKDLIGTIESVVGKKAVINRLEMQKGDVPITYADITKAQNMIGYNPKTSIKEGIQKFYNWYKLNEKY
ncbi:SDR family NAD(P)-dependent oxidoreductase [Clostridium sp. FP1]|uniref:SDR family NAD(P)-dependent oxidoreductase n=1 Tax=Clostridium sp. FP1 TaxID=2724076 RepID=UPI0013E9897B|nr:SDR family NAD(P)-dependent oxidoreductase [Clostridium sp. FP1]MBZ9636003.1 SDR family NAD(P)-dependent oxidoreductase [Clostridium sp. FP1]